MHSVESNNRVPSPYIPYTPSSPRWPQIIAGAFVVYAGLRSSMPMKAVCIIGGGYLIYNNLPQRAVRSEGSEPSTSSIHNLEFVTAILGLTRAVIKFFNTKTTHGASGSRGPLRQTTDTALVLHHEAERDADDVSPQRSKLLMFQIES